MTTIACKGGVLAADMGSWCDGRVYISNKLYVGINEKHGAIAYAGCGARSFTEHMKEHIFGQGDMPNWKDFPDELKSPSDCCGIVMLRDGTFGKLTVTGRLTMMLSEFVGEGGGASFVEGAMAAGSNAREAVELAITFTDYARHGAQSVTIDLLRQMQADHEAVQATQLAERPAWLDDYTPPKEYCTRDGLTGYDPLVEGAYELAGKIARNHGRLPLDNMSQLEMSMLAKQVVKVINQRTDQEIEDRRAAELESAADGSVREYHQTRADQTLADELRASHHAMGLTR